jgi:quinoprotein glucose dehydrogenase
MTYKADAASSSYSPLDEINVSNVNYLQNVWTFQTTDVPSGTEPLASQSNPIIIDGVIYANSAKQTVYAINAKTGQQIWSFNPLEKGDPSATSRGVTYWEDGRESRILYSVGNDLLAIDAKTGKLIATFGENGKVNLNISVRDNPDKISVALTTPGSIFKNLIIIGSRLPDFYGSPPGYIRAYNVRTGELV